MSLKGFLPAVQLGRPPHMFSRKFSSISPLRALLSRLSPANQCHISSLPSLLTFPEYRLWSAAKGQLPQLEVIWDSEATVLRLRQEKVKSVRDIPSLQVTKASQAL